MMLRASTIFRLSKVPKLLASGWLNTPRCCQASAMPAPYNSTTTPCSTLRERTAIAWSAVDCAVSANCSRARCQITTSKNSVPMKAMAASKCVTSKKGYIISGRLHSCAGSSRMPIDPAPQQHRPITPGVQPERQRPAQAGQPQRGQRQEQEQHHPAQTPQVEQDKRQG